MKRYRDPHDQPSFRALIQAA